MTLLEKFQEHLQTNTAERNEMTHFQTIMALKDDRWDKFPVLIVLLGAIGGGFALAGLGVSVLFSIIGGIVLLGAMGGYGLIQETRYNEQLEIPETTKDDVLNKIRQLSTNRTYKTIAVQYLEKFEEEQFSYFFWNKFEGLMDEYQCLNKRQNIIEEIRANFDQSEMDIDVLAEKVAVQKSLKV